MRASTQIPPARTLQQVPLCHFPIHFSLLQTHELSCFDDSRAHHHLPPPQQTKSTHTAPITTPFLEMTPRAPNRHNPMLCDTLSAGPPHDRSTASSTHRAVPRSFNGGGGKRASGKRASGIWASGKTASGKTANLFLRVFRKLQNQALSDTNSLSHQNNISRRR